jgi:hypothetical protein
VCFEAALRLDGDILLETDFTLASHGNRLREATSKHLYSPVQNTQLEPTGEAFQVLEQP